MSEVTHHVLRIAVRAGQRVFLHAKGEPAILVAYGLAAGITVAAVSLGYGGYYYGQKLVGWVKGQ